MILERLHDYLRHINLSFNKLEISLGVSHGSISNAWKHKKNIGSNVIENILITYPEISAEWLLRGKGEMFVNDKEPKLTKSHSTEKELNKKMISQMLRLFNVQNRSELQVFLNRSSISDTSNPLEELISNTWEKKYGHELEAIKLQIMTLFTNQLDFEQKANEKKSDSKII